MRPGSCDTRAACTRVVLTQITGQPSVLYYANQIFERAGFAAGSEAARVSVLLGVFKLVMTLAAVACVDRLGRRPLLLAGVSGMVVALLLLTATQGDAEAASAAAAAAPGSTAWLSAAALLLYVGCYQVRACEAASLVPRAPCMQLLASMRAVAAWSTCR